MPQVSETYWIYRDGYPAKRFIGADASTKAAEHGAMLARNYPGSVVSCSLQKLWETEVYTLQPVLADRVKEKRDA